MDVKWEILKQNIGTVKHVAILRQKDGTPILYVYEGRTSHRTMPYCNQFSFINTMEVTYDSEQRYLEDYYRKSLETFSTEEILEKRLKYACKLIEENFRTQVRLQLEKVAYANS